jgi:hypothetical protein
MRDIIELLSLAHQNIRNWRMEREALRNEVYIGSELLDRIKLL